MARAILATRGRITIPKQVRERLGVKVGDRLEFVQHETGACEVIAGTRDVRHLKGIIARPKRPVLIEKMNAAVALARRRRRSNAS